MDISKNPFVFALSLTFVIMVYLPLIIELMYIYERFSINV